MHPTPSPEAIKYDLFCHRCGYNLRGLNPDGLCPECGQPVTLAFRERLLRYAAPDWVKTIHRGVRFELVWVALLPMLFILQTIATSYVPIVTVALCLLFSAASMFITVPEPLCKPRTSFVILRISTAVGFLGILGLVLPRTYFRSVIPELPCTFASLLLVAALVMKIDALRNHARRLVSWDVVASFTLVIWMGGFAVLSIVTLILVILFGADALVFVLLPVIFILILIVYGTYLNALAKLNGSIRLELDAARRC